MEPVLIGEKASQELREAQAMIAAGQKTIMSIVVAVREAKGLPDTWQATQLQDGKFYFVEPSTAEPEGEQA